MKFNFLVIFDSLLLLSTGTFLPIINSVGEREKEVESILSHSSSLQLSNNGIRQVSGTFVNNGIWLLREGHPNKKPWPSRLGVGHGANPFIL